MLTQLEEIVDVEHVYEAFDRGESGWIKVELDPAAAAAGRASSAGILSETVGTRCPSVAQILADVDRRQSRYRGHRNDEPAPGKSSSVGRRSQLRGGIWRSAVQEPNVSELGTAELERRSALKSDISREMVRLYKDQFGRGPTKARTEFAGPDTVVCVLEHTFTPAERRMVEMGEHQRLRDVRMFFQHASEKEFCAIIERLIGRRVRAFVSGVDTGADVSTEVFHLEPEVPAEAEPG